MKKINAVLVALMISFLGFSQEDSEDSQKSNIQTYTPSKLLKKGQWDVKWFNNYIQRLKIYLVQMEKSKIFRETLFLHPQ